MNEAGSDPSGPGGLSRRKALTVFGVGAAALIAEQTLVADGIPAGNTTPEITSAHLAPVPGGYAPDGTAGRTAALPLNAVELLDSPFLDNQARNTAYLLFLDPERMLRSFRLNYGQPSAAEPIGGWERPASLIRGHTTGHLLSALALTYANTGNDAALARGRYLVSQLAALQARATPGRLPPRLLVGVSRGLLRPAGKWPAGLVAVLHDPQVPSRDDRPVPAGRR